MFELMGGLSPICTETGTGMSGSIWERVVNEHSISFDFSTLINRLYCESYVVGSISCSELLEIRGREIKSSLHIILKGEIKGRNVEFPPLF